jgi:glycerophosphoryl diester phosphodiesterase
MARVERRICETTLSEILAWDIAQGFEPRAAAVRVPTLEQVLEALPSARLNIDIKQSHPDMVPLLLQLLHRHRAAGRVLLTSFEHRTVSRIRRAGYGGQTGLSQREAIAAAFAPPALWPLTRTGGRRGRRLQIPTSYRGLALGTARFIERFQAQDLRVDFWVVNDPAEAGRLLDLGADGIVSDVPELMAPLFATHPRTQGWRARHPQLLSELSEPSELSGQRVQ